MAETFGFEEEADADAFGFEEEGEDAPVATASSPPKDKVLVPRTGFGSALEALGLLEPAVERVGKPKVGGGETALNKAVNTLPAGAVATDAGTAGALLLARTAGKAAPDAARALSGAAGRLLPEWMQLTPVPGAGATLTPQALKELGALGVDANEPTEAGALDTYRKARDTRRVRTEAGEEQNPLTALGGTVGGLGLGMLAPLPKFTPKGGAGAGLLARIGAGAKTGGAYGGLAGLTSGEADTAGGDVAGTLAEGATGLGLGLGLGGVLPLLGAGAKALYGGVVKPNKAAQALAKAGVEDLTLGQQNPNTLLGSMEGAGQSNAIFGPMLKGQREAGQQAWRSTALNKVRAPGAPPLPKDMPPDEAVDALGKGFNKAYGALKNVPMPTKPVDGMLVRLNDPALKDKLLASADDVAAASRFIQNEMSRLPPAGTATNLGTLIDIRSEIRKAISNEQLGRNGNLKLAALLRAAEDELTRGIDGALPAAQAKALRAIDTQYGKFKIAQDAAIRAGDMDAGMSAFTPSQLGAAVKGATARSEYGAGGGRLRELSSAGKQVFKDPPQTGWGGRLAGGPIGYFTTPLLAVANQPGVKPFMLGQAPLQRAIQNRVQDVSPLLALLNPPQATLPQLIAESRRTSKDTP
jgi:hypothetical protein